ncbi:NAD(P)-binding Rossmann-fold superfamily protein isoform X2 [Wolffia australiana]
MIPQIALLGAGIFVRTQYIPRLRELADFAVLKTIWSRSEESARAAAELVRDFAPEVDCKWGDEGLEYIAQDPSIHGVAVVLAGQIQVDVSLRMIKAGKHVIQEKPAAESTREAESALLDYRASLNSLPHLPIWAVAENYRFEPAFAEARKLIEAVGDLMNIQVIVEGSMNNTNPYFSSPWRRKLYGGFILDMGVHYIAGLRMVAGSEVATVSAAARHVDASLPPPDNLCAQFKLANGCPGILVITISSPSPRLFWRFVGSKGTVQVERGVVGKQHGYTVLFYPSGGSCQSSFHPFCGVTEELKAFFHDIDISQIEGRAYNADSRSSFVEAARDVAVLEAMLESSEKDGAPVAVKAFF